MKKLLLLSMTLTLIAAAHAQDVAGVKKNEAVLKHEKKEIKKEEKEKRKELRKLEGKEASDQSKQAFYRDFGNIPVIKWERSLNYDKAVFMNDGREMTAYYDAEAQLVGTTQTKMFTDIPASAQKYIAKKYAGYTPVAVTYFDDNEHNDTDMILYGSQFEDADNYFVEMKKGAEKIVLQVNTSGEVFFFGEI